MMVLVFASRILGLVRNRFLAHFFPVEMLDAYRAAFVLPDFVANILITSTLSVAFIPIFTSYLHSKNEKEGWRVASSVLNISLAIFAVFALLLFIFAGQINEALVVPGFKGDPEKLSLTNNLTSILLFGEFILIIGSFFTSVLQSFHRFIIPAVAPVLYNLGIIVGILWIRPFAGLAGVGWGVVLGSILHVLIQLILVRKLGFRYRFRFGFGDPGVLKIIKLSLPRSLGVAFSQAEGWVSIFLASILVSSGFAGSVAILGFAGDIQNFPIGLFGITFATAAFPTLAAEVTGGKLADFKSTFLSTLHQILYLTIPLSILFMVLRIPVVRILLGTGLFDWSSTVSTAVSTSYFAVGIFAQSSYFLLIRAFYALQDAATPLKVALVSLIFHAAISTAFVLFIAEKTTIPVAFLGLAASGSGIFSFVVLLYLLDKKVGGFDRVRLYLPILKIIVSAALMGALLYLPLHIKVGGLYVIDRIIDTTRVFNLLALTAGAFLFGLLVYAWLTWWLQSEELKTFMKLIPDLRKLQKFLVFEEKIESGTPGN